MDECSSSSNRKAIIARLRFTFKLFIPRRIREVYPCGVPRSLPLLISLKLWQKQLDFKVPDISSLYLRQRVTYGNQLSWARSCQIKNLYYICKLTNGKRNKRQMRLKQKKIYFIKNDNRQTKKRNRHLLLRKMAFDVGKMSPSVDVKKPFLLGQLWRPRRQTQVFATAKFYQPNLTFITLLLPAYLKGPPSYRVCGWVLTLPPNIKTSL